MAQRLIRSVVLTSRPGLRAIMTSENRFMEKVQEELKGNPYYDKYADKIEALKKEKPAEFYSKLKEFHKKKEVKEKKSETKATDAPKSAECSSSTFFLPKSLGDIIKLDMIQTKSAEEISHIWHEFHRRLDCISNVLSANIFKLMQTNSNDYPTFILPIPRQNGYEFMMVAFKQTEAHFALLSKYHELGEKAPEVLYIKYYTDLVASKNLVLMKGMYDKAVLSNLEANCLASSLQLYYGDPSGKRTRLLDLFTNEPDKFQHMDLISDFEAFSGSSL